MEEEIVLRIKQLMLYKGFKSETKFANKIGIGQVTINTQLNSKRRLGLDVVSAILNTFSDISAEWLMRGKGEMLNGNNAINISNNIGVTQVGNNNNNFRRDDTLEVLNEQIAQMRKELEDVRGDKEKIEKDLEEEKVQRRVLISLLDRIQVGESKVES